MVSIDGHEDVPENSEDDLMKAVANQPVSVAIDAGSSDFQFYSEVRIRATSMGVLPLGFLKHKSSCNKTYVF